ncbi:protein HIRA/HIR1 [Fistulifera solaris]|uniref:Protein HIRA n=1 Tax=Fistulifera solaris TaxID=1519565 RepID=A0A1Z5JDQ7_FISSO|nr:protein HIRA/HIR1 [Fistulifera solaris]|eukprot:GAX12012.1 protein HIRA/HIR1 [Fistulifera solaris]
MVQAEIPLWMSHNTVSTSDDPQHKALALWQNQQKCAIYSIDIFEHLVATAGGDGTVKLWNSQALFAAEGKSHYTQEGDYASSGSSAEEEDESPTLLLNHHHQNDTIEEPVHDLNQAVRRKKDASPRKQLSSSSSSPPPPRIARETITTASSASTSHRLICTLSAHTGSSVLAVRFAPSGRYLASAGDDGAVCIYAPSTSSSSSSFSSNTQWSRIRLCRGHNLDVVDLAWAPDDSHLVSCSLDSETPIIVWKLTDLSSTKSMIASPYKILGKDVHKSTVKGVDFDPAGSYFASSGDDPAVCIWRAHDDWGLEQRIDASTGIFKQWGTESSTSNQSLFRRLSWSTDGSFLCATNAVVRHKNVASTIRREGWNVGADSANLVGHKQPVVVSRHASYLLDGRRKKENSEEDEDHEPEAATLLALGDRRGFVTVWSTKKSRPIFKLQCSESRCTVTDLAWGKYGSGKDIQDMVLLVSLLDGQVVAIQFHVPDELGPFLSSEDQARVFQLRYGIEMDSSSLGQRRKMLVGKGNGASDLIENAFQMSLEESVGKTLPEAEKDDPPHVAQSSLLSSSLVRKKSDNNLGQDRRKRARLVQVVNDNPTQSTKRLEGNTQSKVNELDPLQAALNAAERATDILEGAALAGQPGQPSRTVQHERGHTDKSQQHNQSNHLINNIASSVPSPVLPHNTNRVHITTLPITRGRNGNGEQSTKVIVECTNSSKIPSGAKGNPVPCIDVVIKKDNTATWSDQIVGTSCAAVSASNRFLAIGTADGSIQLYGTSPSIGWLSANAFRSHPPLICSGAVVSLRLEETEASLQMLVVTSDGSFGLHTVFPRLSLVKKGSILPPMTHMALSAASNKDLVYPQLSRIQITKNNQLLLLLSFSNTNRESCGVGGSVQSFVYNDMSELWMRLADSRFVLSDFYSSLPSRSPAGRLTEIDDSVKLGALESTLKASHRNASAIYLQGSEKSGNFLATRAHCEDRLACAVAFESGPEYRLWLGRLVRILSITGDETGLRLLTEMILGRGPSLTNGVGNDDSCWWLSLSPEVLKQDRKELIQSVVLPEMSKNRSLQRLTNELSLEIEHA